MAEFQTKKNTKKMWHSPLMLFVLLSVLLVFMYNMVGLVEKTNETSKKKKIVLSQVESLSERQKVLEENIKKLQTENGTEVELRDKYHLVKEGEQMVVIVDEQANTSGPDTVVAPKRNFLQFLKNLLNN
jgi:cell division protein FtsB